MRNPFRGSAFANVTAVLALVIALGGTSYAATKIGTGDLKNNAVTSAKIDNNTIRSKDVRNGNLRNKDLATNTVRSNKVMNGGIKAKDVANITMRPLDLAGTWVPYNEERGAMFGIDASGVVHLAGGVKNPGAYNPRIGVLPDGYRPTGDSAWVTTNLFGGAGPARVVIQPDGDVYVFPTSPATTNQAGSFTSLDISFVP